MLTNQPLGPQVSADGVRFSVWSSAAEKIELCLFDDRGETERIAMERGDDDIHTVFVSGLKPGARYGLRSHGPFDPDRGLWFDPNKLLLDPYATTIDHAFMHDPALSTRNRNSGDTARFVPKGVVQAPLEKLPGLGVSRRPERVIYELQVKAFTKLHPEVPEGERGTLAALAHPAVIDHLKSLHVGAVELMPITAWIDERHLAALGLSNAWGYNPVSYFAVDPRFAPMGLSDLRKAVTALHAADIAVIMDVVYNHNGESDFGGNTLSFRGLDPHAYFRHDENAFPARLINDTGCGNTFNSQSPVVRRLVRDSLRHFTDYAGIDGFRFDLAPIMGRRRDGFDPDAPLIRELMLDDVLGEKMLIAEPWDIGPGGYQLGGFPRPFLEWNDKYRDDVRRFWRGDHHTAGNFATRIAGSSDVFNGHPGAYTRSVNFIAAHDGFSLADIAAYKTKHNHANGEENRDGHSENLSWNHGVEGPSDDAFVQAARERDVKALLTTLFMSRGHIMITAGDEFGRTQRGNNNAYAQDNETTWLDWENRDLKLEQHSFAMARQRLTSGAFATLEFLNPDDVTWVLPDGTEKQAHHWDAPDSGAFAMVWRLAGLVLYINRTYDAVEFALPDHLPHPAPARTISVDCRPCEAESQN